MGEWKENFSQKLKDIFGGENKFECMDLVKTH